MKQIRKTVLTLSIISIFYLVGVVGHSLKSTLPYMILLTPWVLASFGILTVCISFLIEKEESDVGKSILWLGIVYLLTYFIEVIGVSTGMVFGSYTYGSTLGLQILDTPIVIGLNWTIVVLGITLGVQKFIKNPLGISLIVGILSVGFDFVLEPLAMSKLDYWSWEAGFVPIQNYIAWFITASLFSLLYVRFVNRPIKNWIIPGYVIIQFLFFSAVRIFVLGA